MQHQSLFRGPKILGLYMPHRDQRQSWCRQPRRICAALVLSIATASIISGFPSPVAAQSKPSTATSAKKAPAQAAAQAYAAGVQAFDKGKVSSAVTSLSAALLQGGLPPQQMAKALFYRGSAYRKQKKPAQAISDLTSAIWIKGGLSDGDRLAAMEQRKAAYKEAGLGSNVPQGLQPGAGVPNTAVATTVPVAPRPAAIAAPPTVTSAASGTATSAWATTAGQAPQVPQQVAKLTPPPQSTSSPFSALAPSITPMPPPSPTVSTLPKGGAAPTAQAGTGIGTAVSNIGSSISQGLSGVGSFFGTMFSSNSATPTPAPDQGTQIATSSTARTPQLSAAPQAPSASAPVVTQGWGSATKPSVTTARTAVPRPVQTAAIAPKAVPTPKPRTQAARSGKFRLQVAAVRSKAKAQQVVAQLMSKYANELAGGRPEIDATAIGNMGTFYRVRVGPYADTKAPRGLCARLKPDGFDCLIVTP